MRFFFGELFSSQIRQERSLKHINVFLLLATTGDHQYIS
jgi:hypothetical protein